MGSFFELDQIASILEMLERHDVTEFKLERGDEKMALRRGPETVTQVIAAPQMMAAPQPVAQQAAAAPAESGAASAEAQAVAARVEHSNGAGQAAAKPASNAKEIRSPMVGTFYRRPAVDAEPYVSVGDSVKKGDVLCIVEAMKLMNEIETDVAGKIVEIRLEDGQMVEYGEVLFRIEPN